MKSWFEIDPASDFSIHNIPFGIISQAGKNKRVATRIGDSIIDLYALSKLDVFSSLGILPDVFNEEFLNEFIAEGKKKTNAVRKKIQELLTDEKSVLKYHPDLFSDISDVQVHMPVKVTDYTDFYSSIEHATNLGKLFRDPENALLPNWRHLPVGYHGRASSIIESGVSIHRPKGQQKPADGPPVFGPCKWLDFELEVGFIIGKETQLSDSVTTATAEEHIFGLVLFNDWSARDIQKWEYVPLGPFLGKSFASSISPWVVTLEALDNFRVPGPVQEPAVLDYLQYEGIRNIDLHLEVSLEPQNSEESLISVSNFKYMYWNMAQQLTHHTINGCNVQVGDMMASGTISGKDEKSFGSMLEMNQGGKKEIPLKGGATRKFIQDYDSIIMRGHCEKDGLRVGFGEVRAQVLPAK